MALFYQPVPTVGQLTDEEAAHALRVLRLKPGAAIELTDGKGSLYAAEITTVAGKQCHYRLTAQPQVMPRRPYHLHLAIAPTKNADRLEWMVEKCCEIGIDQISLVHCHHSERKVQKVERLVKKAVGAMKQSGNLFLPAIAPMVPFKSWLQHTEVIKGQAFIGYVDAHHNTTLQLAALKAKGEAKSSTRPSLICKMSGTCEQQILT